MDTALRSPSGWQSHQLLTNLLAKAACIRLFLDIITFLIYFGGPMRSYSRWPVFY